MAAAAAASLAQIGLASGLASQTCCAIQVVFPDSSTGWHGARILQLDSLRGAVGASQPFLTRDSYFLGDEDLEHTSL